MTAYFKIPTLTVVQTKKRFISPADRPIKDYSWHRHRHRHTNRRNQVIRGILLQFPVRSTPYNIVYYLQPCRRRTHDCGVEVSSHTFGTWRNEHFCADKKSMIPKSSIAESTCTIIHHALIRSDFQSVSMVAEGRKESLWSRIQAQRIHTGCECL